MESKNRNKKILIIVLNVIKEHLDIELSVKDLDRSRGIGRSNSKSKSRPIIVNFISYNDGREIFNNKIRLDAITGVPITESLTADKMGRIMYKDSTSTKPKLFYGQVVKHIVYGKRKRFLFRIILGIVKFFVKGKEYV